MTFFAKIKREFNDHILIIIFILYNASCSTITSSRTSLLYAFLYTGFVFFSRNKKIGKEFWLLGCLWLLINFINVYMYNPFDVRLLTVFTRLGSVLMFYFIIKSLGGRFLTLFVGYVTVLSLISLPLYILDFSFPDLFDSLSSHLNVITADQQRENGGWYIFVYMHNVWAYLPGGLYRNSGFMWEPGGYSMMLICALIIRLSQSDKIDLHVLFLAICVVTTFSTSGLLALAVLLVYVGMKKTTKSMFSALLYLPLIILGVMYIIKLDFIGTKIIDFIENSDHASNVEGSELWRVNRISILIYNVEQSLQNPWGNGIYDSQYLLRKYGHVFSGSNTIANVLYSWGYIGVVLLFRYTYLFLKRSLNNRASLAFVLLIAYFIVLFSNSMEYRPLIFVIGFYPIVYKNSVVYNEFLNKEDEVNKYN